MIKINSIIRLEPEMEKVTERRVFREEKPLAGSFSAQ